ncbi:MAG TPA: prephenate dehydrogenase/arogenate dehydrogenase family protein [Dehalococcoidia bacterium]|nr:prephenate dehydrogenase/arogenate dehydrogenase family protein [Dehalococcoidia bacterium]
MERIAIIGLGLIGGSIGLALKAAGLKDMEIAGTARTRETLQTAKKRGAIDRAEHTPADAVRDARLVIVATPIMRTKEIFEEIAPALSPGAVVTDAGSTKGDVMRWARDILPPTAFFVGGHPMAGKEQTGIDAAEAGLFRDKPWVVVPSLDAPEPAVRTVIGLAQACGAAPRYMDADEHDSYVAAISHLPLVVASALFSVVFDSQAWPEMASLASSGFRDTTRLASGSAEMAHDIMATNRENVLHWLDRFQQQLDGYRRLIAGDDAASMRHAFERAALERDNYMLNGPPRREPSGPAVERVSFSEILLGSWAAGQFRRQQELLRDAESRAEKDRR